MKKGSLLMLIGILLFIVTLGYSGYLYWQGENLGKELKLVKNSVKQKTDEMQQKAHKELLRAIASKETVSQIKADLIKWSKVITDIRKTIPRKDKVPIVHVLSYSGSSNKDIAINVKTQPDSEEPYFDTADLIEAFNQENVPFADAFVSSIAAGVDEKGRKTLSFLLTSKYVMVNESIQAAEKKADLAEKLGESLGEILKDSDDLELSEAAQGLQNSQLTEPSDGVVR